MQQKVSGDFDHMVLLYKNSETLINKITEYILNGFAKGEPAILVLKSTHKLLLEQQLKLNGYDLNVLNSTKRLFIFDADETMQKILVNGKPDTENFKELISSLFSQFQSRPDNIRVYGEMVAVLWSQGHKRAALELEKLWNDFGNDFKFDLFCAYSHTDLDDTDFVTVLGDIDRCHSRVVTPQTQLG